MNDQAKNPSHDDARNGIVKALVAAYGQLPAPVADGAAEAAIAIVEAWRAGHAPVQHVNHVNGPVTGALVQVHTITGGVRM